MTHYFSFLFLYRVNVPISVISVYPISISYISIFHIASFTKKVKYVYCSRQEKNISWNFHYIFFNQDSRTRTPLTPPPPPPTLASCSMHIHIYLYICFSVNIDKNIIEKNINKKESLIKGKINVKYRFQKF